MYSSLLYFVHTFIIIELLNLYLFIFAILMKIRLVIDR